MRNIFARDGYLYIKDINYDEKSKYIEFFFSIYLILYYLQTLSTSFFQYKGS
jgi:hypothetical protein